MIKIRPLVDSNLEQILSIENNAAPFPWSKEAHQDAIIQQYPSLVLTQADMIAGFIVFNYYLDECHLLNLVIDPSFQSQGYGKKLANKMMEQAREKGMKTVILEVRESNSSAIKLYERLGFKQIGTRKNYYRGNLKQDLAREDAIVMQKPL
ncbi:ribosomal protein S18-alanine N-acetyltransferase [Kangiella sp. HZ709]|uniref:ribosomal protein S18-alanine N-acetyltransferase n=1 Tax=Kangiella sp. HZ709 TaxID=2666328 RepID=UPI0012B01C37|nr:ribosomal protein S18-alanine N-acetyltransferase [Kangiella sp. HZ709]MRX28439.1 ribosomal-protein-alanine N-acetyltransferase [Kangiella sp. HZ709]